MHKNPYNYHATPMVILVPTYLLLGLAAAYGLRKGYWPLVAVVAFIGLSFYAWRKLQHRVAIRKAVREILQTYSSIPEQVRLENDHPLLSIPADLQGAWEDVYHPDLDWFRAAYSHDKLVKLEAFNVTFRENALKLNARVKSIKLWHKDKRWKVVMGAAGVLFHNLG